MKIIKIIRCSLLATFVSGFLAASLLVCPPLRADAAAAKTSEADLTDSIKGSRVFAQRLTCIGEAAPTQAENEALWNEIQKAKAQGFAPSFSALEQLVQQYPNSPWRLSLQANLAKHYRKAGRYTKALETFESVWRETGKAKDGPAKSVADFAFANWVELLASLGRVDTLRDLFSETQGRTFDAGPLQDLVLTAREGYSMMVNTPEVCFRCGTYALNSIGRALHGLSFDTNRLFEVDSPGSGFSMAQLAEFCSKSGLDLVPCQWPRADQKLIVPSVVHWRQDHYAAILQERNGRYFVADPTFGHSQWLDGSVIAEETSGHFMVPREKLPSGWKLLAAAESQRIFGRGFVSAATDRTDSCSTGNGGSSGSGSGSGGGPSIRGGPTAGAGSAGAIPTSGCSTCSGGGGAGGGNGGPLLPPPPPPVCCPGDSSQGGGTGQSSSLPAAAATGGGQLAQQGSAVWDVSLPYVNVWIYDMPLSYSPGVGQPISLKLAYKQRGTSELYKQPNMFSFGTSWECSWLSFTVDAFPGVLESAGGGERSHDLGHDIYTGSWYTNVADGYTITYPDGSQDHYGFNWDLGFNDTYHFLTEKIDRFGHKTSFVYTNSDGNLLLLFVIDGDGRTNKLAYTNIANPVLVTSVTDPFNRTAYLQYNSTDALTNIIDSIGLQSAIAYNSYGWPSTLITAYGTNTFSYLTNTSNGGDEFQQGSRGEYFITRAVTVADPLGGTNIFALRQNSKLIYTNATDYSLHPEYGVPFIPRTRTSQSCLQVCRSARYLIQTTLIIETLSTGVRGSPLASAWT